jgi:Fuc2NAc and GlcNAc transferase
MIKKLSIKDHPNARSAHTIAVPTGGGVAIVVAFYLGLFMLYFQGLVEENLFYALLCGLPLAIVSFVDDLRELSPKFRIMIQFISVVGALFFLGVFSVFTWYLSVLWILSLLWLINLYNFLDGIDGYAGSEGVFVSLGAYLFYHDSLLLVMVMAIVGFLLFNWQRASIFMGDVGSTFLGFFFGVMILYHYHDSDDIMIWWVLLGLFIVDATTTLIRRAKNGEKLFLAHKKHAFQRLVQSGYSHQKVVLMAMGFNIIVLFMLWSVGVSWLFLIAYNLVLTILLIMIDKRRSF